MTNRINALLNGLCVLGTGTVENLLDALDVTLCPLTVWFACDLGTSNLTFDYTKRGMADTYLANVGKDDDGTNKENSFLIHDVELV